MAAFGKVPGVTEGFVPGWRMCSLASVVFVLKWHALFQISFGLTGWSCASTRELCALVSEPCLLYFQPLLDARENWRREEKIPDHVSRGLLLSACFFAL
ncbi:hypothetical protein HPB50_019995 [Hyalomma asiaticum]|uniref:Uncharacterized protein n=1 Tax=Hyalomma asiaticum TaxID=266040 RepID=A0ACB7RXT1_HYAAI|nr:hypothetical protein HPB50_019995 [Hyalomma asiaticum]